MKFSIIIPTIGRKTLLTVLESIFTNDNFEIIKPEILLIFDGKISQELKLPKNPQLKIFETGKKVFASGARNLGIKKSTGDVLIFIGDDTIPQENWLQKIVDFHQKFTDKKLGLLGKVSWTEDLKKDKFHQFLEKGPQFNFLQIEKNGANWKHFYTSNVSVKRKLIGNKKFSNQFSGWGFEDIEFGYQLEKEGMNLIFNKNCEVLHDDLQTFSTFIKKTKQARKNALIFEKIHPETKILPHGKKLLILNILIFLSYFLVFFSNEIFWWREWKKAWIKRYFI